MHQHILKLIYLPLWYLHRDPLNHAELMNLLSGWPPQADWWPWQLCWKVLFESTQTKLEVKYINFFYYKYESSEQTWRIIFTTSCWRLLCLTGRHCDKEWWTLLLHRDVGKMWRAELTINLVPTTIIAIVFQHFGKILAIPRASH